MKKLLGCLLCVMLLFTLATPASAIPFDPEIGLAYHSDLGNMGENTVTAWLEGVVSVYNGGDPGALINYVGTDFSPDFGWTYAVVHIGNASGKDNLERDIFAYIDAPGLTNSWKDNILNPERTFQQGVSFVRYYGQQAVPEPATMLLLGSGLIGLAGFGRKKFKK